MEPISPPAVQAEARDESEEQPVQGADEQQPTPTEDTDQEFKFLRRSHRQR